MPCFKREKSLSFCPRRDRNNERDPWAPKPVRARAIKFHGLFGITLASQHLIMDNKWTPMSLHEQFSKMTELLRCRVIYKRHEVKANRQQLTKLSKQLKTQCADGRLKLMKVSSGNNSHHIRNYLIKHRDMQRLYQKMPIHLVADNINQRTFVMRKERDRLEFRLCQLKHTYKELLLDRAELQNLIKYDNEYVLKEELQSRILLKKIANSGVRQKAIRIINTTYKKMVQVLLHDEIFYEPILRSLDGDIEDQANFIKHILYLGMPAISKFKELNQEYNMLNQKSRKNLQAKIQILASLQQKAHSAVHTAVKSKEMPSSDAKRYVRATESMVKMRTELRSIEKTIKELKMVTLSSQAKEIYLQVKTQMQNNEKLHRAIMSINYPTYKTLIQKMKCATVMEGVLINNLSSEEINRLERIADLKKQLKAEQEFEEESMEYLKNRADLFVMLRISMWNFIDILRHVDRNPKTHITHYPNSYLKLPFLKFDMLTMRAVSPENFEEDVIKIMLCLKRKVYRIKKMYTENMEPKIKECREKYDSDYLASIEKDYLYDSDQNAGREGEEDLLQQQKTMANVPNRKQIKAMSARILEDVTKAQNS